MDNAKASTWNIKAQAPPTGEQIENGRNADEIPRDPVTP